MIILNNIIWLYSNIIIFSKIVIKNKDILLNLKLSPDDKKLLKKRIRIEHTNSHLKQYKRLSLRYDKYSINYQVFIHLACIDLITKRTNIKW